LRAPVIAAVAPSKALSAAAFDISAAAAIASTSSDLFTSNPFVLVIMIIIY
jgi:hypothetical protein